LRHKNDCQNEDSHQGHEKQLAYSTTQPIHSKKCHIIGWEGEYTEETLQQENITPQVLQVENQAKTWHPC
jgi:hypothetical protein